MPVGIPFGIGFELETGAGVGGVGGLAMGASDFYGTLWFDASRPIFNLPDGWDAQSSLFQGNVVPEPSSLMLLALGTTLFMARAAIRRSKNLLDPLN